MLSIVAIVVLVFLVAICIYGYLVWNISNQETIGTNEIYYVRSKDLWEIRLCRFRKGSDKSPPILFVHGFGSNQNNFLTPHGHSIVDYLKDHDFDCWTMDMRGCKSSKPPFEKSHKDATADDVLAYDLPAVIDFILNTTGHKKLFWLGHSLGGMLLYAYLLQHGSSKIAGGITLGAPIGFLNTEIKIPPFAVQMGKRFAKVIFLFARMLIPILKTFKIGNSLFPINPYNIHPDMTAWDLCKMVEPPCPKMIEEMAVWVKEKKWIMLNGQLNVLEHINEIDIPILLFYAPQDPFVNLETAKEFFNSLKSRDKQMLILAKEFGCKHDYNHCDLAFGENGKEEVFIPVCNWLEKRIGKKLEATKSDADSLNKTL